MCPFGDIKDVPDSCDGKSGFFIVGSLCATCPLSKTILHLSVACLGAELQSVTDQTTNQPTSRPIKRVTEDPIGKASPELKFCYCV